MAVSEKTELKIEAEAEQTRAIPASIDLVYPLDEHNGSAEAIFSLLKADCRQDEAVLPAGILKEIANACEQLQTGLKDRFSEFLKIPNTETDFESDLDGWIAIAELKQIEEGLDPYLKIRLISIVKQQYQLLEDQSFSLALLQRLRIFVHDYNNVSHIAQGYLGYALEEIDSKSDLACDVQGAIEAVARNSLLTEELSNLTQKHADKNNHFTQVHSLIYNFLEARKYPLFESFIANKSRFIVGEQPALLSALLSLSCQFASDDIEVSAKIESIGNSYEHDAILLLPGEYLVLRLLENEGIAKPATDSNQAIEIAWATKIITSLGGEVENLESDFKGADTSQSIGLNIYLPLVDK